MTLGSNFPFDMASVDPVAAVEAAHLDDEDLPLVLGGNAERFLCPLA